MKVSWCALFKGLYVIVECADVKDFAACLAVYHKFSFCVFLDGFVDYFLLSG